ncbi:uncharacterized protein LOC116351298, partial [Contarinia nasturtii]|uniref:uncharacterized protein LOC116351298 n=1 Tax=Contarinia nasturtii TaxID=265458 RepID=UPI0012D47953
MFLKTKCFIFTSRRFVQALYIKKQNSWSNVKTLHPKFDFEYRLGNPIELEKNITRRGLETQINIKQIRDQWQKYKNSKFSLETIEKQRLHLQLLISKSKTEGTCDAIIDKYLKEARALRIDFKSACDENDQFHNDFLELPNKLSSNTPDEPEIVFNFGINSTKVHPHHLTYDYLIEYVSETAYYLQNEAATFDHIFSKNVLNFLSSHGFIQFINPDFAKTSIIEAGGVSLKRLFEIKHNFHENCTNLVHLVGNGSWLSFLGFIAKTRVDEAILPMKYVTTGQIYRSTK